MGRNLDDLDDFFWAVCFPDLDYLRFTENSGSNMQKFIEIVTFDSLSGPLNRTPVQSQMIDVLEMERAKCQRYYESLNSICCPI